MTLDVLRAKPIPPMQPVMDKKSGYRAETPIDADSALGQSACVDVRSLGVAGRNHYATAHNPPYFQIVPGAVEALYLRRPIAEKLAAINERLQPMALELYVFDAWRPQAIQRYFHDVWFPDYLRQRHPDWADDQVDAEVELYWAAPSAGESSPSPHGTGGAVDLTLRSLETGQAVFMGGLFDDLTDNAHTDHFERPAASMSDEEAQANRRVLYWTMSQAGFANNPTEWWHYSYGDQMWARLLDRPSALLGACDPTVG